MQGDSALIGKVTPSTVATACKDTSEYIYERYDMLENKGFKLRNDQ